MLRCCLTQNASENYGPLSCTHVLSSAVRTMHATSCSSCKRITLVLRSNIPKHDMKCAGPQIVEVASTSSYQLQLQQLQAEEAAAGAKAAADSKQAELQAALEALQQASRLCTVSSNSSIATRAWPLRPSWMVCKTCSQRCG